MGILAEEEISSLAVRLALDDSNFNKGVQNLKRSLGTIDSEFKSSVAGVKNWGNNLDSLKNNTQSLGDKIEVQQKIVQAYSSQLEKSKKTLEDNSKSMMELKTRVDNTKRAYETSKDVFGANDEQTKKLKNDLNDLTQKYKNNERTVLNNNKTIQGYTIQLNNAQGRLKNFESQLDSTNKKIANFKLSTLSASLKESGERFKTVGDTAGRMGDSLLMISAPLVGIGIAAGKVGINFETSMSQAAGALNKPISQMGGLRELALKTGQDTQFSATQAGQAITELAKGGLTEAQIKGGSLKATMDLAASSSMDLGIAANTVVQAMGAFKLSAEQSSQAVNALAGAAAESSTDVEPLTEGLAQCAAQAHLVGWSIQDTTAVLGEFADAGVVGQDAGTSLKTMLQRLGAPTKEAAAEMKSLGINIWDDNGHMKDAAGISQELQSHMSGLSDSAKQSAMNIIFGSDATRAASILMDNGTSGLQRYTKATNDQNAASRLAQSQMGETAKAIEQMKGSLETAAIKLEGNFAPAIKSIADSVGRLADAFGNLSPGMQTAIVDFGAFTLIAGGTLKVVGGVAGGIGNILGLIGKLSGGTATAAAAAGAAETATAGAGAAMATAATASGGLASGFGTLVATAGPAAVAIGGVGLAAYGIHKTMTDKTIPTVDLFADKVQEDTGKASNSFSDMNSKVKASSSNTSSSLVKISDATKKAVQSYMSMDNNVKKTMTDIYVNSNNFSVQAKNSVISQYTEMANRVSGLTANQKDKTITDFKNMITNTSTLTSQNKSEIIAQYTNMVNRVSGLSSQQKQQVIKSFRDTLTQSVGITKSQANNIIQQFNAMGAKIKAGMNKQYTDRYTTMKNFFTKSSALSTQEEQKILSKMTSNNNSQKAKIDTYEKQVAAIYQKAITQHRQLTQTEQQQVNSIQDKMRTNAVQSLSKNEIESKTILERIKSYGTSITEQQAQDIIKSANKQRDGAIAAANQQYDKVVADAIYQRDVAHTMTADQADKVIKNAGAQRDGAIQAAKDQRTSVVDHLSKMDGEVLSNMNTDTGEMLSPWQKVIGNIKQAWTDFATWFSKTWLGKLLSGNGKSGGGNYTFSVTQGKRANGGIVTEPEFSLIGEAGTEAIIPLSGSRRNRGLSLWMQAGKMLGVNMFANGGIVGGSNGPSGNVGISAGVSTSVTLGKNDLSKFEKYGEDLNKYLAQGIQNTASIVSKSSNLVQSQISTLMSAFVQKYLVYGQQINKNLGASITQNSASAIAPINSLNSNIGNIASTFVQSFITHGHNSVSNLGVGITGNELAVNRAINKITGDNESILDDYSKVHTDYGTESMSNLGDAITGNEDVVTNASNKVTTDNKTILSSYVQLHTTYGTNSMHNLTTGINSAAPSVLSATNKVSADNKNVLNALATSANPIGQNVSNGLSVGMKSAENNAVSIAQELTQKVIEAFTGPEGFDINSPSKKMAWVGENAIQGFINGMSKQDVLNFFKNKIGSMINYAQGASGQIAGWLTAALAITGQPMSALPALEQIAMSESGGNPLAINLWDSNAAAGHPSKGLMQTIDSTFNQYAIQGLGDIWNPIANAVAAIRYMLARYGSIFNVPGIKNMASGGGYVGYASGTDNAIAGWRLVGENGPELEYSASGGETILNTSDTSKILSTDSSNDTGNTIGASLVEGISNGIADKMKSISDVMSNLGKTISIAFKDSLEKYNGWDEFENELAEALNDSGVYINNSVVKLNTILADSVMKERDVRAQYFEDYNSGVLTADAAITKLDVDIKNLQTSTGDFETDTRNLLGAMTDQSTEINILTAEYNKLGNQYGYNSDKALDELKKIQDARDAYQKTGKDILELVDNLKESEISDINDVNDKLKDALKQRYQDEQDAAEKQINLATDTQTKILQTKIDALDEQESNLDIQYQDEDDADKRAELERQLSMHYGAEKKKELQEELDDLNKTEERRHQKESLDQQKDDLQKQIDQLKEENDTKIKSIEDFYTEKLKDANIDAEAQKLIVSNNQSEIISLLKSYGKDYELTGASLGDRLVNGFKGSLTSISDMISNLKSQINDLSTDVDLSSINSTVVNTNSSVQTNNISLDAIKQATQQAVQSIVLVNKTILDGKQLSEGTTKYDNINQGYNLALARRGL